MRKKKEPRVIIVTPKRAEDLTGRVFGLWTVIGCVGYIRTTKNLSWLCKCKCGGELYVQSYALRKGLSKKCPDCSKEYPTNKVPPTIWKRTKNNAAKRDIEFNITNSYAFKLFKNQKELCSLSGVLLNFPRTSKDLTSGNYNASLDRIDSYKGYIRDNVQWLDKDVNLMKRRMSDKEFIELCEKIVLHQKLLHNINI